MRQSVASLPLLALVFVAIGAAGCGDDAQSAPNTAGSSAAGGSTAGGSGTGGNGGLIITTGGNGGAGGEENPCLGPNPPDNCHLVPSGPACGDGEINQDYEVCDDGNAMPGDGCNGACAVEPNFECLTPGQPCVSVFECGNGVIELGEVCDDGNALDDDGCNATCEIQSLNFICPTPGEPCQRVVFCGDGRISGAETCDDGNSAAGDGCDADCLLEPGYVCRVPGSGCDEAARCGDGILNQAYEACDDGNNADGDGCSADCRAIDAGWVCPMPGQPCVSTVQCGNGVVFGDEHCDDGNSEPNDGCHDCQIQVGYECPYPGAKCIPLCGDALVVGWELCDDGNRAAGDGCSPNCEWEDGWACLGSPGSYSCHHTTCGDGIREGPESCDDGNFRPFDGCSPDCQAEPDCSAGACTSTCGDGVALNEGCDDGNLLDGDGCSSSCTVEPGYYCDNHADGCVLVGGICSMPVPVIYRDFNASHSDFEPGHDSNGQTGLVQTTLDSEGKPVFTGRAGGSIASTASFEQWYRDSAVSSTIITELVLWDNGAGGYVNRWGDNGEQWQSIRREWCGNEGDNCQFEWGGTPCDTNPAGMLGCVDENGASWGLFLDTAYDGDPFFFPLDDHPDALADTRYTALVAPEYGGNWEPEPGGALHNFHFTTEVRYWFEYDASSTARLDFTGDDDVWVFVNRQLALDLGGWHPPLSGTVTINATTAGTYGLVDGSVYEIAVFHAERMTEGSSFHLTLSGFSLAPSDCNPDCGDGVVTPGEACDNGSNPGGYGECNPDCTRGEYCGDGILQAAHEDCDDGLNISAYGTIGCAPGCIFAPSCGDGIVQGVFGETCDGVNDGQYGNCTEDCRRAPWCGDGIVQPEFGEECDDGLNDGTYNNCGLNCLIGPGCGDGILQEEWGELCDDGNTDAGDGCSPNCKEEGVCGDAFADAALGEECDDGVNDGGYGECAPGCVFGPRCGDAVVQSEHGEACDEGTFPQGDGTELNGGDGGYGECSPGCVLGPHCGDGLVQDGYEECDDGKRCVGGSNEPAECTDDTECPGGSCLPDQLAGNDGCSAACREEVIVPR